MGVMNRVHRWRYVYGWRLRYWWLDTKAGLQAQMACRYFAALVMIADALTMGSAVRDHRHEQAPHLTFFWFIIMLVIMVGAAVASYAMRPKAQQPAAQSGNTPTTEDGQMVVHHFGECWVDDSFILAWKVVGTDKIKSKGGKK